MIDFEHSQPIYDTYAFFFTLPFSVQRKNVLFSALMAGEPYSWKVIGISRAALELLANGDFRYKSSAICRAHIVDRIETATALFSNRSNPLSKAEFFELMRRNGSTIITTKSENKVGARPPSFIPIDTTLGLFRNKLIFCSYGAAERTYLRKLHSNFLAGSVSEQSLNSVDMTQPAAAGRSSRGKKPKTVA